MSPRVPGAPPRNEETRLAPGLEVKQESASTADSTSPFANRRRFLIWALMIGAVPPERVTERILAELAAEVSP